MIRKYGNPPYAAAVIHGGPGAKGSLGMVANELGRYFGVLEPIQTQYTIEALLEELNDHIYADAKTPLTLIGHSWGAWLAALYAAEHPEITANLVLVGCAPLEAKYVPQITEGRINRLTPQEGALFRLILEGLEDPEITDKNYLFEQLQELTEKADNYELEISPDNEGYDLPFDDIMYTRLWPEAAAMRANGDLIRKLVNIECPVYVIHGENDPHPLSGITIPLSKYNINHTTHVLRQCGHTPFLEKHAKEYFYDMLLDILRSE